MSNTQPTSTELPPKKSATCTPTNGSIRKAIVTVLPKPSVLDPQGAAAAEAMKHMGLNNVGHVRIGKVIEIALDSVDETKLHQICRDLLSNPVIEDYHLEIQNER